MDFSIVVPVYNKEKSLEACIGSLLGQNYPGEEREIIFVDNNSTDSSASIIRKYPAVKLISEKTQGAYAARNAGILAARGSVIAFTDADVEVKRDWLKNIRRAFDENGYDMLIGWCFPSAANKLLRVHSLFVCERIKTALARKDHYMLVAGAGNLAVKRMLFEKEGLFIPDSYTDDTHFVIRCCEKGYKAGFDESIAAKRNDVNGVGIYLLKNFIYICSDTSDMKHKLPLSVKLRYLGMIIKFIFRNFPAGLGLLPINFCYFSGYFLARLKILKPVYLNRLVGKYTDFTNSKGL
jgi:glycosyltransferase involved in cell wall biosynthesis